MKVCHIPDSFNTPSFVPLSIVSVRVAQCSFPPLISVMSVTETLSHPIIYGSHIHNGFITTGFNPSFLSVCVAQCS